jgi:hypothetical protein
MSAAEIDYPCVGVCMNDPDSGYCLGCGRPPAADSPPLPSVEASEVSRYPVASELIVAADAERA